MEYPETPELDRMLAVHEQAQQLGEFLEWLTGDQGAVMCEWRDSGNNGQPKYITEPWPDGVPRWTGGAVMDERYGKHNWEITYNPDGKAFVQYLNLDYEYYDEGFHPIHRTIEGWLAAYFNLDQERMDRERDAVLAYVREQNSKGDQG